MEIDTVRVPLTDVQRRDAVGEALSDLTVHAVIAPVQDARSGGIALVLEYLNQGRRDVELFNPIDHIQYMILDDAGYPVNTPPYAPRLLIHTKEKSDLRLEDKFLIVSIRENDRDKDVQEEVLKETIIMASGARYDVTVRIQKIIDARSPDTPINIPPGAYTIVLTCTLVKPAGENNEIRLLQSDKIPIELR